MTLNGIECVFHHLGIPTMEERPGERFSELFGMHTSDSACRIARVQWHRFEPGSSLPALLRTVPHLAFKVCDLEKAVLGYECLLGPYEPLPGFVVAVIEEGGQPIELIQTLLTDEQIWSRVEATSVLYESKRQRGTGARSDPQQDLPPL